MFSGFKTNKCKTQTKLCIARVSLMRNKREQVLKQMRKEVAELLRANKQENARIRVEAVIREQNMLQAYEVLEVFLELLAVRLQLIEKSKDIPNDMFECLASLVYSAARIQDFPELVSIRGMLGQKFGKEFIEKASSDSSCRQFMVNENIIRCLAIGAPDPEQKLSLLSEIAQEHSVEWDSHRAHQEMITGTGARNYGGYGGGGPSFPGSPGSSFDGGNGNGGGGNGGGGGGNGNLGVFAPRPAPIYAPPPQSMSPQPVPASPQSKFKNMLKKVPTLGKSSPSAPQDPQALSPGSEEWRDAHAAASAAREYSQRAQHAADAAQRYASSNASSGDLGDRAPGGPAGGVHPSQAAKAAPSLPDYPNIDVEGPPPAGPDFRPMTHHTPPSSNPGPGPVPPPNKFEYRTRSDEEIQRAYDAAPGPPVKDIGKPSPWPTPSNRDDSSSPARDPSLGLPSAPGTSTNGPPKTGDVSVDDELAARFEALKRG